MNLKDFKPFALLLIALVAFIIHKTGLTFFYDKHNSDNYIYSIELLYIFFFISSSLIIAILTLVMKKNINNVGFLFLFLTTLKMGIAYFFLKPILETESTTKGIEKFNFFIIFILFLAIETTISIKMLNKKQ